MDNGGVGPEYPMGSTNNPTVEPVNTVKTVSFVTESFPQTNATMSNSALGDFNVGLDPALKKRSGQHIPIRRSKKPGRKQVNGKHAARLFASKEAQEEILKYEEIRSEADAKLDAVYDEIRPAIEERERDNQDSVPTVLAEKWIEATCLQMKANFDLNFSVVKNALCPKPKSSTGEETNPSHGQGN
ncbi:hypothetical protein LguiA_004244 [Lonicera macranthoides]